MRLRAWLAISFLLGTAGIVWAATPPPAAEPPPVRTVQCPSPARLVAQLRGMGLWPVGGGKAANGDRIAVWTNATGRFVVTVELAAPRGNAPAGVMCPVEDGYGWAQGT